jgi:xanthine/CO dehydrogenase XdhC/CoxF family maturation factor
MDSPIVELLPLYRRERAAGRALALAVVLETAGSTYSKAGQPLLLAHSGEYAGLLSGGCLEGDLREHARAVIATGEARQVSYDMRGPDDRVFGLGAGCEGAMQVLLLRVGAENGWQPLAHFEAALAEHRRSSVALIIEDPRGARRAGEVLLPEGEGEGESDGEGEGDAAATLAAQAGGAHYYLLQLGLPPRLLLLGAGPDSQPVVQFASALGWQVTVYDHRPALVESAHFPGAERVLLGRPEQLAAQLRLDEFTAVVVMSHHLDSDAAYLAAVAPSRIGYVGLLGPAPRRERLRADLGPVFAALEGRLRSPVGLALGGRGSAQIALAIVAEIQAWLHEQPGSSWSALLGVRAKP